MKKPKYEYIINQHRALAMLLAEFPELKPWNHEFQERQKKENWRMVRLIDQIVRLEIENYENDNVRDKP